MLINTIVVAGLLGLAAADSGASSGTLFDALDANGDGVVEAGEVQESQQVWFTRALRMGDANDDGRLTSEELNSALTDPEPRPAPRGRGQGQRRRIDPRRMDRNGDGQITLEEVPEPGRERFQQLLQRTGRESIPVDELAEIMQRGRPPGDADRMTDSKQAKMKNDSQPGSDRRAGRKNGSRERRPGDQSGKAQSRNSEQRRRAMQAFNRLDANGDGRVTRREARRNRQFIDRLDLNDDGVVDRSEVQAMSAGPSRSGANGDGQKRGNSQQRPEAGAFFERLDANGDGHITRDEAPQRMKSNFDRIDSNGDGKLTQSELQQAMRRRQQKSGKPNN